MDREHAITTLLRTLLLLVYSSLSPFLQMGFHDRHPPRPSPTVKIRSFCSYTPNAKLRKSTTARQLQILEAAFKRDKGLNAQLCKQLSSETKLGQRSIEVCAFLVASSPILTFASCNRFGFRTGTGTTFFVIIHTYTYSILYPDEPEKRHELASIL